MITWDVTNNGELGQNGQNGQSGKMDDRLSAASKRAAEMAGGVMGATVIWDLGKMLFPVEAVKRLVDEAGVKGLVIPEPTKGAILAKALRNLGEAGLVEEVNRGNGDRVVYQLTRRLRDRENDLLLYAERLKIAWYKKGVPEGLARYQRGPEPIIVFAADGVPADDATDARVRELVNQYRDCYGAREIAYYVLRPAIDMNDAISLRRNGGAYFVPVAGIAVVDGLRAFLKALSRETGVGCSFYSLFAPADDQTREEIGLAAMNDLRQKFASLEKRLAEREADSDKVQVETAIAKQDEITALAEQVRRYETLCKVEMAELKDYASKLRSRAESLQQLAASRPEQPKRGRRNKRLTLPSQEYVQVANAVLAAYGEQDAKAEAEAEANTAAQEAMTFKRRGQRALGGLSGDLGDAAPSRMRGRR